jgi:uncharacterized protein (TIGR03067 family)
MHILRLFSASLTVWCALGEFSWASAQEPEAPLSEESLQGTWRLVALEQNGKPASPDQMRDRTIFFGGGAFVVREGYSMKQAGTIAVDSSTTPKSVTMIIARGDDQGKSFLGIYAIEKDTLKICLDRKGQSRPDKFETDERNNRSLATYTRVVPADPKAIDIAGTYLEETPDENGNMNQLEVAIERRGDGYQVAWKIMGRVAYVGTGIRKDDLLSVCWVSQGQVGLSVLQIEKGPKLSGHYSMLGSPGVLVPESLVPKTKSSDRLKDGAGGE